MGAESRIKEELAKSLDEGEVQVPSSDSDCSKENEDSASPYVATPTEIDTVLNLTDSSEVIQFLLSMLYPGARRFSLEDEDENSIIAILRVARKYKMESIIESLCTKLVDKANSKSFNANSPLALRVYAIACHLKIEPIARAAARAALRGRGFEKQVPELELITGMEYHRLLHYHRKATENTLRIVDLAWAKPEFKLYIVCGACGEKANNNAEWWQTYVNFAKKSLRAAPRADIFGVSSLHHLLKTAMKCSLCAENVFTRWSSVSLMLEREIEQSIDLVSSLYLPTLNQSISLFFVVFYYEIHYMI